MSTLLEYHYFQSAFSAT